MSTTHFDLPPPRQPSSPNSRNHHREPKSLPNSCPGSPDSKGTAGAPTQARCQKEVAERVALLYKNDKFSDVTFVVYSDEAAEVEPVKFVAHRNIVASWSAPLEAMLGGGFQEGDRTKTEVVLRDIEPESFEILLRMMYCGDALITENNVLSVLECANRFDVGLLMQYCVQFLQVHTGSHHATKMLEVLEVFLPTLMNLYAWNVFFLIERRTPIQISNRIYIDFFIF